VHDLIVVGGGPAGLIAAGRAAERGKRVLLLERGPALGRKLLITAGGRCNVTNTASHDAFMLAFGRQGGFLRDALRAFDAPRLIEWLRLRGIAVIEERKGRVFPADQSAATVLRALADYAAAGRVEVRLNTRAQALLRGPARAAGVRAADTSIEAAAVLLATGGLSYPATGATGDGYRLAREAGHTLVQPWPAVVALETREDWPARVQGTPVKNVSIQALAYAAAAEPAGPARPRKLAEVFGEALWTHYGISGPAILDLSRDVVPAVLQGDRVELRLDLRPADTEEALDERLLHAIKRQGKCQVDGILGDLIAARTARLLLELNGIDPRKKMCQVSKSDRRRILRAVKGLTLQVARPRPIEEAIVTGGGIPLAEVDPRRMESRLLPGLHFAGEILDLAGPSGGYNLQCAFSTGWLVAESL